MGRSFRKTIAFCLALAIMIGIVNPIMITNAIEKTTNDGYILKVIAENEYTDGVRFGDGYLMLKNGKFDNITSNTTYTIIDADGNKKEIKNNIGFTELYLNTSGNSYYVDDSVLVVGKNKKVALVDESGKLYGGSKNFYSCVVYAGNELFYTTDATQNIEDKANTTIWTLRKKDGTKIKDFNTLDLYNRAHANGYEYIRYDEGGVNYLIAVDKLGNIKQMGTGYSSFITNDKSSSMTGHYYGENRGEYVTAYKKTNINKSATVFKANGTKLFEVENCTDINVNLLDKYGYARVQLSMLEDGQYKYSENIVDIKGNFILDSWKYDGINSYDDKMILVANYNSDMFLMNHSKEVKVDIQKFAKGFGESYSAITFSTYYVDSTLTVTVEDTKSKSDIGTSFFFDSNGNKIAGDIKGTINGFDGKYAILYDKKNETKSIIDKNGGLLKGGYSSVYLEWGSSASNIVARCEKYGSEKVTLLLKDKSEISKYDSVNDFINGHALVTVNENGTTKYGIIDEKGNEIVKVGEYTNFKQYKDSETFIGEKGGYIHLFNTNGKNMTSDKKYKQIGDYVSNFYKFSLGRNLTEYENEIGKNNVAITLNDTNKLGLIKVQKLELVTAVSLNTSTVRLAIGKTETLKATINPINATNKNVVWSSNNKNIATVDSKGNVKGINKGTAIITVTTIDGNKNASCTVTVQDAAEVQGDWKEHWGKNEIQNAMEKGWINKTDKFRPEDAITRAEFIKIANKAFGFTTKATSEKFTDVDDKQWWYNEVLIALKAGYISGNNSTFRPNDKITREEVAAIITTIKKNKDTNLDKIKKYTDFNKVSTWAQTSVEGSIEAGYMGVNSTVFNPKQNITRAQAVVTLYRVTIK